MDRRALIVPAIAVALLAALVVSGYLTTRRGAGGAEAPGAPGTDAAAVSAERGRRVFWTRGRCALCHAVGGRGGVRRGPALSEGENGPAIGARAALRAEERSRATGRPYTATDYLVESVVDPAAYLVEGFRNEMPPARQPPTSLSTEEIRAVVAYLQSLGGSVDFEAIRLPEADAPALH
jgi:mono/diheme cytochrome c family protein